MTPGNFFKRWQRRNSTPEAGAPVDGNLPKKMREPWIDAVRAIAVILVVLFHFLLWTYRDVTDDAGVLHG